ncbi:MAG: hypothetical protein Q3982_03170 [Phoenicibacter congonensis]|uniref:Uncharacterized protein n=1 Tax=Phoenicibacter congonensis TaxID=1944646 RepID=A0AA43RH50_9ACTN|nr:hypothetical protein [Phoenicibacter congonensis]
MFNALWTKAFGFAPKAGEEWNIFLGIIGASSILFEFFKAKSNSPSSGSPGCLGVIALLFAPLVVGLAAWGVGCLVHSYVDWFPENAIWWFIMALPLIQLAFIAIFFLAWIATFAQFKKFKSENKHTLSSLDIVQINEILEELEVPERMFLDKEWETDMVIA